MIPSSSEARQASLLMIRENIRREEERLKRIDRRFESSGMSYTADDIIAEFNRYGIEHTLIYFMNEIIVRLRQKGKIRTSETYRTALNSFWRFLGENRLPRLHDDDNVMLDCIDSDMMERYESWQRKRGIVPNTISFYNRILRAVYNRAVEKGIIENSFPFRHVYTGTDKTVKRALPLSDIRKIRSLHLKESPVAFARDMFMLSFYMRGMSFVDMAFLRKRDLKNGYVIYRRRKTGQQLVIEWTKEMQAILDRYPKNKSEYLLPIIKTSGKNERYVYRNMSYRINHNLKKIAALAGLKIPLTLYVARHSWASVAKAKGIPLSVISEGMGHDSEMTTQIYLASLESSVIDKANSRILESLG